MLDLIDLPSFFRFAYVTFTMLLTPVKLYFATSVDTGYMCELHHHCTRHVIDQTLLHTFFVFNLKTAYVFFMTKISRDQN